MKKVISIFAIFLIVLCTACIYKKFEGKDKNIYYLALGDSLAAGLDSYGDYGHGYAGCGPYCRTLWRYLSAGCSQTVRH